jgi:hypothetical protein
MAMERHCFEQPRHDFGSCLTVICAAKRAWISARRLRSANASKPLSSSSIWWWIRFQSSQPSDNNSARIETGSSEPAGAWFGSTPIADDGLPHIRVIVIEFGDHGVGRSQCRHKRGVEHLFLFGEVAAWISANVLAPAACSARLRNARAGVP